MSWKKTCSAKAGTGKSLSIRAAARDLDDEMMVTQVHATRGGEFRNSSVLIHAVNAWWWADLGCEVCAQAEIWFREVFSEDGLKIQGGAGERNVTHGTRPKERLMELAQESTHIRRVDKTGKQNSNVYECCQSQDTTKKGTLSFNKRSSCTEQALVL